MHRFRFWPQNSLQMANTIKNWISLNLQESEKSEKISSNNCTSFLWVFYSCLVTKTAMGTSKNSSKRWWNFFRNLWLTENPINFDVTYSVILGTVKWTDSKDCHWDLWFYQLFPSSSQSKGEKKCIFFKDICKLTWVPTLGPLHLCW